MTDAPAAARPLCPRCRRPGFREHDGYWCFEHGPYAMQDEPWDPAEIASPDAGLPNRQRHRRPTPPMPAWTPEELREWETWQEGDPLPGWARTAPEEEEAHEMTEGEITGNQLTENLRRRMRTLAKEVDELLGALEEKRKEAAKIEGYFKYIGEPIEVPEVLWEGKKDRRGRQPGQKAPKLADPVWCCGKWFDTAQGLARHRTYAGCQEAS